MQAKPLAAYGVEHRQTIFYGGGVLLIVGAAVSVWLGQRLLAACLAGAAATLLTAPSYIDVAAPFVAVAVGVLVLVGIVWAIAHAVAARNQNVRAAASTAKLAVEGKFQEAIAAFRESEVARTAAKKAKA